MITPCEKFYYILQITHWKSAALPAINKPTIKPKRPKTEPKISITRILTNNEESAASETAAVDPVIPTATPQIKLLTPTVIPAQNKEKPVYKLLFEYNVSALALVIFDENTIAMIKP